MSATERQPRPSNAAADAARAWWRALQPASENGEPNPTGDRAALARLRRAATVAEAMADEAAHVLYRRLGHTRSAAEFWLPRAAVVAAVLAHVRKDASPDERGRRPTAARTIGRKSLDDPDSAPMKPLRFKRLLACRDLDDLAREMRRLVALAGGTVDVGDLAVSILWWNDRTRARWAFDYYAAAGADAEPDAPETATDTAA